MTGYVPTTGQVREAYIVNKGQWRQSAGRGFDAWLDQVKAEARREGQAEAWDEAEWAFFAAHKRDHHEPWCRMPDNPYRQEVRHVDQ